MREEWASPGLTRGVNSQRGGEGGKAKTDFDRIQNLTMATRAMRLKPIKRDFSDREVSERRQVGDLEEMMSRDGSKDSSGSSPWWKNVGMDEGL
ncbi:hypothetical protein KVT40_005489 [Elsinoe batatas]|uniref:Uncharacterized protein n=1 Tax=Elsinoe batatas TaxID=2601811 RepID=A0A8K0L182_9PEZI|nr:hypothetical protein KVT40_005489 [Elsinoe batatas]